ncbi:MAG: hypothetical protein AAGA60_15780 [Cyanobacteria bacterium P01_E01_bin.42]
MSNPFSPLAEWRDRLARLQSLPNLTASQVGEMESLQEVINLVEDSTK